MTPLSKQSAVSIFIRGRYMHTSIILPIDIPLHKHYIYIIISTIIIATIIIIILLLFKIMIQENILNHAVKLI